MTSCNPLPPAKRFKSDDGTHMFENLEYMSQNVNQSWTQGQTPWFEYLEFTQNTRDPPSRVVCEEDAKSPDLSSNSPVDSMYAPNASSSADHAVKTEHVLQLQDGKVLMLISGRVYKGCGPFFLQTKLGFGLVQYQLDGVPCQRNANPEFNQRALLNFRSSRARAVNWLVAAPIIVHQLREVRLTSHRDRKSMNRLFAKLLLLLKAEARKPGMGQLGLSAHTWTQWLFDSLESFNDSSFSKWTHKALSDEAFVPFLGLLSYPRLLQHVECSRLCLMSWEMRMRLENAFDTGPATLLLPHALLRRLRQCREAANKLLPEQHVLIRTEFLSGLPSSRLRKGAAVCLDAFESVLSLPDEQTLLWAAKPLISEKGLRRKYGPSVVAAPAGGGQSELHRMLHALLPEETFWSLLGLCRLLVVTSGSTVHHMGFDAFGLPHLTLGPKTPGIGKEQKLLQGMFRQTNVDFSAGHYPGITALMSHAGWLIPLPARGGDKAVECGYPVGSAGEHFGATGVFGVCEQQRYGQAGETAMVCFVENFHVATTVHRFLLNPSSCMPFWTQSSQEIVGTTEAEVDRDSDLNLWDDLDDSSAGVNTDCSPRPILHARQIEAIETLRDAPVILLTGPAGTGKTFTITQYCREVTRDKKTPERALFCAPTHELVNKLNAEGVRAVTLQHFVVLGQRNPDAFNTRYAAITMLVIDEVSMIDEAEFANMLSVLRMLPSLRRLALLGDWRQLPSVRSGNLLQDLIFFCHWNPDSPFKMVELTHNYRVPQELAAEAPLPEVKGPHEAVDSTDCKALQVQSVMAEGFSTHNFQTLTGASHDTCAPDSAHAHASASLGRAAQGVGESLYVEHAQLCRLPSSIPLITKVRVRQAQEAFAANCVFSRSTSRGSKSGVYWHALPHANPQDDQTDGVLGQAVLYALAREHVQPERACITQVLCSTNDTRHAINRAIAGKLFPSSFGPIRNDSQIKAPLVEPSPSAPECIFIGMKFKFVGPPCTLMPLQTTQRPLLEPKAGNKARFLLLSAVQEQTDPAKPDKNLPADVHTLQPIRWADVASGLCKYTLTCVLLGQPGTLQTVRALAGQRRYTSFHLSNMGKESQELKPTTVPSQVDDSCALNPQNASVDMSAAFEFKLDADTWSAIELGYAVTTHAMQGLEEKHICFVLEDAMCVNNPVLYTALTRARQTFVGLVAPRRNTRSSNMDSTNRIGEQQTHEAVARIVAVIKRSPSPRFTVLRWLLVFADSFSAAIDKIV
jgi:hypothetical protein